MTYIPPCIIHYSTSLYSVKWHRSQEKKSSCVTSLLDIFTAPRPLCLRNGPSSQEPNCHPLAPLFAENVHFIHSVARESVPLSHASIASGAGQSPDAKINRKLALDLPLSLVYHTLNSFSGSHPAHTSISLQVIQFFHNLHWIHCFVYLYMRAVYVRWSTASWINKPVDRPRRAAATGTGTGYSCLRTSWNTSLASPTTSHHCHPHREIVGRSLIDKACTY